MNVLYQFYSLKGALASRDGNTLDKKKVYFWFQSQEQRGRSRIFFTSMLGIFGVYEKEQSNFMLGVITYLPYNFKSAMRSKQ